MLSFLRRLTTGTVIGCIGVLVLAFTTVFELTLASICCTIATLVLVYSAHRSLSDLPNTTTLLVVGVVGSGVAWVGVGLKLAIMIGLCTIAATWVVNRARNDRFAVHNIIYPNGA